MVCLLLCFACFFYLTVTRRFSGIVQFAVIYKISNISIVQLIYFLNNINSFVFLLLTCCVEFVGLCRRISRISCIT